LVDLNVNMRRFTHAADTIVRFLGGEAPPPREMRVPALMRLAEIHADGEMDAHRAAAVLRDVLREDPANQEAHYRIGQELYLSGRYNEARQHIEKCIEIAAAPGSGTVAGGVAGGGADLHAAPSPELLARYYYYLGRILEAMGDTRSAGSQYRRAAEYDPSYGP